MKVKKCSSCGKIIDMGKLGETYEKGLHANCVHYFCSGNCMTGFYNNLSNKKCDNLTNKELERVIGWGEELASDSFYKIDCMILEKLKKMHSDREY